MLSGSWARGSSRAPLKGKTGMRRGRLSAVGYRAGKLMSRSREQDRGEALATGNGELVLGTPGLEELDQLLAGRLIVPAALLADDAQEVVKGLLAAAGGIQRQSEVVAGLVVGRVLLDGLRQAGNLAGVDRGRGKIEGSAGADDGGIGGLG